jgi:N-acetyl-gamma-glutamyl-phosphate reductase
MVENPRTTVINASTAFRTDDDWAFGLPELAVDYRDRVRALKRISVPGCHASAFLLALTPLVRAGIVPADARVDAFSITGYSGGGKKMIADYEAGAEKLNAPRMYALGMTHKHLPEMQKHSGLLLPPAFVPMVGSFYKGLSVTVYLRPRDLGVSLHDIQAELTACYTGEPFVRVLSMDASVALDDGFFDPMACNDTNRADICVFGNAERAAVIARLDNLGKGASGAAIQCMNAHLGLPETTGLHPVAVPV